MPLRAHNKENGVIGRVVRRKIVVLVYVGSKPTSYPKVKKVELINKKDYGSNYLSNYWSACR